MWEYVRKEKYLDVGVKKEKEKVVVLRIDFESTGICRKKIKKIKTTKKLKNKII